MNAKRFYDTHKQTICKVVIPIACFVIFYIFFKYLIGLVLPFVVALLLSLLIGKPVEAVSKKSYINRTAATVISMLIILTVLFAGIFKLISALVNEALLFALDFPSAFDKVIITFGEIEDTYNHFFMLFPEQIKDFANEALLSLVPLVKMTAATFAKTFSLSVIKAMPKILIFTVVTTLATFFITKDKDKIINYLKKNVPTEVQSTFVLIRRDIFGALGGYIRAQLILMCFSGLIAVTGLFVLRYKFAILIGALIAVVDALPVFGSGAVLWPFALYKLISGEPRFALGLMIIYFLIILSRNILEPKVLSTQIGLYPLVTLAAIYAGFMTIGALGVIAGPMFVIVVKTLYGVVDKY